MHPPLFWFFACFVFLICCHCRIYCIYEASCFLFCPTRFNYTRYDKKHGAIYKSIEALDKMGMDIIETGDPDAFKNYLLETDNTICGRHPISVFLNVSTSSFSSKNRCWCNFFICSHDFFFLFRKYRPYCLCHIWVNLIKWHLFLLLVLFAFFLIFTKVSGSVLFHAVVIPV